MKRVQEKIKDLVDIRTYETIKNYQSDAHATIAAYRFTDATADLMAKWIDEIVELNSRQIGAARALAGTRGVGKSHFLAVVAALAQHSELRTRISDAHVGMSAQRLPRQKHFVVAVERGLGATLEAELHQALDKAFGSIGAPWGETVGQMLAIAASRAGNLPLIVIVDSAADRPARVKREDGALLGEMAEFARQNRVFLAIALDDDIAGADGVNAAIARTCAIDFLDAEHLYRVADAFLFPKRANARFVLRDLYQDLREAAVGFNWSEPRFAALYPVHPIVVDIAPAIRLYAPKFSFLGFAADSAGKLINRPAHSLLALDEVFDRVEPDLRKAAELEKTFALYDELAQNQIQQIPIMQRLQAKMILKGLFLLSLDGRGASAREIGAAMLIYDENNPLAAVSRIEDTIRLFAAAADNKLVATNDNGENRFLLGGNQSQEFENKIAAAAAELDADVIGRIFRRAGKNRFPDWNLGEFAIGNRAAATIEMALKWRGNIKRGRVVWLWGTESMLESEPPADDFDWQVFVAAPDTKIDLPNHETLTLIWQPAALRADEIEIARRFAVLSTNAELTAEFGESAAVAEQTTAALVERIWSRVFVEHGKFYGAHGEAAFQPEAKAASALAETLEFVFKPLFEREFPAHPRFAGLLTEVEVSQIVADVFASANSAQIAAQMLAETFAAPLDLVVERNAHWVLQSDEQLLRLPVLQKILETAATANNKPISLRALRAVTNNLGLEALQLHLAALVARRRLEFVTANNARITHRSLDLQIVWNEIVAVAQPLVEPRAQNELIAWANLLTETDDFKPNFATLDDANEREAIFQALQNWLIEWRSKRILERFDFLPDEVLNVRAWRAAIAVKRHFEEIAEIVEAMIKKDCSLEESLERAIDVFGNQPANLAENRRLLGELEIFVGTSDLRQKIWRYAARAEASNDALVEALRKDLLSQLMRSETAFDAEAAQTLAQSWDDFHSLYTDFYARQHEAIKQDGDFGQAFEQLEQSVEWQEYAALSKLSFAPAHHVETIEKLRARFDRARCALDARAMLRTEPVCLCNFRLRDSEKLQRLPHELRQACETARAALRRTLTVLAAPLSAALIDIAKREDSADLSERAQRLADCLRRNAELPVLIETDARLLSAASTQITQAVVRVRAPRGIAAQPLDDLRQRFNVWLDNLPKAPVLVKIIEE